MSFDRRKRLGSLSRLLRKQWRHQANFARQGLFAHECQVMTAHGSSATMESPSAQQVY